MKRLNEFLLFLMTILALTLPLSGQSFLTAVTDHDIKSVKKILSADPSRIDTADAAGRQAIHFAANNGDADMVSLLLKFGADPSAATKAHTTVLHFAAAAGNVPVINLLLERRVGVDEKNIQGVTPLYFAAIRGKIEAVAVLLKAGSRIDAPDPEDGTPLQAAAQAGDLAMVKYLTENGADILHRDSIGRTALHFASQTDQNDLVAYLIEAGLKPRTRDKYGKTCLFYALENGKITTVHYLSRNSSSLFRTGANDGSTTLHAALLGGNKECVQLVLQHKIDLTAKDRYRLTVMDYAVKQSDTALVALLTKRGVRSSNLMDKKLHGLYPDSDLPGDKPILFAPGVITTPFANERDISISHDFKELYFTRWLTGNWDIVVMSKSPEGWSRPAPAEFSSPWMEAEAFFTPDERQIFFISTRPEHGAEAGGTWEIWSVQRSGEKWGKAEKLDGAFTGGFYTTFTKDGIMHLTLGGKMQYALPAAGGFTAPVPLPASVNGNHGGYNGFVAPDESYLIFSTTIPGDGFGEGDLYITFKTEDGGWTAIRNMGSAVNSFARDYCPAVSPDGKYFFFSSRRYGTEDIFWMKADIIEKLKKKILGS